MQTVSQPDRVFLCTSSRITIILEKRCVRHGCTHPQHRVTNKEWVSEGIPRLHCHSPKVKHCVSTHVNWLDDCFSFSVHTLTPQQDFSCFDFIGFWLARQGWSSDSHLCCSHICLLSANSYTAQLNIWFTAPTEVQTPQNKNAHLVKKTLDVGQSVTTWSGCAALRPLNPRLNFTACSNAFEYLRNYPQPGTCKAAIKLKDTTVSCCLGGQLEVIVDLARRKMRQAEAPVFKLCERALVDILISRVRTPLKRPRRSSKTYWAAERARSGAPCISCNRG